MICAPSPGVTARPAMCDSQPISSPVSSKMAVPPAATCRSKTLPTTGLAVIPLVPSEPPQIVPTTSSAASMGARGWLAARRRPPLIQARPAATVARVPPSRWMTRVVTGRPLAATVAASRSRSKPSQPSETSTAAPDVGVGAEPFEHVVGIGAGVAAAEPDDVRVVGKAGGDRVGDDMGALDGVDDRDEVADARRPSVLG